MPIIHDPDLADVLMSASADDMGLLIDVITDSGKGRKVARCQLTVDQAAHQHTSDSLSRVLQNRHQLVLSGIAADDIYGTGPLPVLA